ncbi:hypothetical protein T07_1018 [Trichinella nelsoni]|uniref:Uncharacterized protein n=1 Tax=Trichinella nelsoni TaxID=6336 RepID=A0A0V0RXB4_9BILA|nr:hypothetical protein T07_1018 [Trichinella nelsoni]
MIIVNKYISTKAVSLEHYKRKMDLIEEKMVIEVTCTIQSDVEHGIVLENCESRSFYTLHAHFSIQLKNNVKKGMAVAYR